MQTAASSGLASTVTRPYGREAREAGSGVPLTFSSPAARTAWSLTDQAVSSLANFAVTVVVARAVSPHAFGVFAFAYTLTFFALQLSRAFTSEPLMIRHSASPEAVWRLAVADAAGVASSIGLFSAAVSAGVAVLVSGQIRSSLLAVAAILPGLLVQDLWRFAFFAQGRPRKALTNDVLWTVLQVGAMVVVLQHWVVSTPTVFLLAWGLPASLAAFFGVVQSRTRPAFGGAARWLRVNSDLSPRYAVEFVVYRGAVQTALYVVGIVGGLTALGGLRAAQALFGPLNVVFLGLGAAGIPEAVRVLGRSSGSLVRMVRLLGISLATVAAIWLVVLFSMPSSAGTELLGATWETARPLIGPMGIFMVASGAAVGPWIGLRALAAAPESLRARTLIAVSTLVFGTTGAVVDGSVGAAVGLAASACLGVVFWGQQFSRALASRVESL